MACIMKNKLGDGTMSYTIQVKAKDPRTNKYKSKNMTWRKPPEMSEYQANREINRIAYDFEERFRKQVQGLLALDSDERFVEYSNKWLTRAKQTKNVTYYIRMQALVKVLQNYFGDIHLKDFNPIMIQRFIDDLCQREIVQDLAKLKEGKSLRELVKAKRMVAKKIGKFVGVNYSVFSSAHRGNRILYKNAVDLCEGLGINFDDYFVRERITKKYSKGTIDKHRKCLSLILGTAKRQRIIEHNFATGEYILPVPETSRKEIQILNDDEARQLKKALDNEPNIRWKTSLYIILMTGIRRGECCGLEWQDIDLEKGTLTIQKSSYDVSGVGLITKDPKTYTSNRTISMPQSLIEVLKEYKVWWENRRKIFGDLWGDCQRLFISDDGNITRPQMYRVWLRKVLDKAGLKQVTLHSLRHTNITLQLTSGVDLKTVSARAGHARPSTTTDIYSHFLKNSDTHASKILNDIFTDKGE